MVSFITHGMHAARVNPSIVKVEQRANGKCVVNGFVAIACFMQDRDVRWTNGYRFEIYLPHKSEKRFLFFGQQGSLNIGDHTIHER